MNDRKLLLIKEFHNTKSLIQSKMNELRDEMEARQIILLSSADVNAQYQYKMAHINLETNQALKTHVDRCQDITDMLIKKWETSLK